MKDRHNDQQGETDMEHKNRYVSEIPVSRQPMDQIIYQANEGGRHNRA